MDAQGSSLSLRSLSPLAVLTAAEASVFDKELKERSFAAGEAVAPGDELLLIRDGEIRLETEAKRGRLSLGKQEKNGLLGEEALFVSDTPIFAEAETDATCFALDRHFLKGAFRYSRTGAVKFLEFFARSMSQKIRSANEVLQEISTGDKSDTPDNTPWARLSEAELRRLESLFIPRSFEPDSVVFQEGDEGKELFVIGEGEVEIRKENPSGESITLARLGRGNFFGELSFIDQRPRSAAAVARGALDVYVVPAETLERAIEHNVGAALYLTSIICKIMAHRLNETLRKIASF